MIQVYSFEEWDPLQPQKNIIEWGHIPGLMAVDAGYHSSPYKDAPLEIRWMFYTEYLHAVTSPKKSTMTKIVKVTFQNEEGECSVYLKKEDAIRMINESEILTCIRIDAKTEEKSIRKDEIFQALKINEQ